MTDVEDLIGSEVKVTPDNGEAPFTGILQQPLFHDDWYVRDGSNDLCGPYQDHELEAT